MWYMFLTSGAAAYLDHSYSGFLEDVCLFQAMPEHRAHAANKYIPDVWNRLNCGISGVRIVCTADCAVCVCALFICAAATTHGAAAPDQL